MELNKKIWSSMFYSHEIVDTFIREGELRRMVGDEVLQPDFMHMSAVTNRDQKKEPLIILNSGPSKFLEI